MCGRVHVKRSITEMVSKFSFADPAGVEGLANQFPRFNGAPTQRYPIIVVDEHVKRSTAFTAARWGLIPHWYKTIKDGPTPFNAKAEGVRTNGMFRNAYAQRRALMPIDGYFEWKKLDPAGKDRQPYAIAMKNGEPFCLAAIWQEWRDPATGEVIKSFAVLTCEPNRTMAEIHNRMPVILAPEDYQRWLFDDDPADLMRPFPDDLMTMWKIDKKVGNVRNDTPDILDPVDDEPS